MRHNKLFHIDLPSARPLARCHHSVSGINRMKPNSNALVSSAATDNFDSSMSGRLPHEALIRGKLIVLHHTQQWLLAPQTHNAQMMWSVKARKAYRNTIYAWADVWAQRQEHRVVSSHSVKVHVCRSAAAQYYVTVFNVLWDVTSGIRLIVTELQITNTSVCACTCVQRQDGLFNNYSVNARHFIIHLSRTSLRCLSWPGSLSLMRECCFCFPDNGIWLWWRHQIWHLPPHHLICCDRETYLLDRQ